MLLIGSVTLFSGVFLLFALYMVLISRTRENLHTIFSVISYPSLKMTDVEILMRKSGVTLFGIGVVITFISLF